MFRLDICDSKYSFFVEIDVKHLAFRVSNTQSAKCLV